MADSTTNLDTISSSQSQKEVTANAAFDALSPPLVYGRRASTCAGLTWGYYGGKVLIGTTVTTIANGTLALTGSATNYIEADAAGAVSSNTSAFTGGRTKLYTVVCESSTVTSYTDQRTSATGFLNAIASGSITGLATIATSGSASDLSTGTVPAARMPALTGDVTTSAGAVATTIGSNKVTLGMMATISTANFLGRTTAGTGNVESLTATQATDMLNAMVGDSGSGGTKGLVPAPSSGDAAAGKFLKADGTWAAGGGAFTGGTLTSTLTLRTGSSSAGSEPLKFVSGSLLTTATAGTMEFLTDSLYFTITTGAARKQVVLWNSTTNPPEGVSGCVPYETTNGRLTDSTNMTFDGTKLNVAQLRNQSLTSGRITYAGAGGDLLDSASLQWDNTNKTLISTASTQGDRAYFETTANGSTDYVQIALRVNSGFGGIFGATPSGFTTNNPYVASMTWINGPGAGGLMLLAGHASGIVKVLTGAASAECIKWDSSGHTNITDAKNVILGTSTGTKIGTGTTQKLGFWNATPVAQKTGYGTPTGNSNQSSFAAGSITLPDLAAHVAQLCIDLKAIGIIGA